VDVLHYDLELGVSDTASWIEGRARIRAVVEEPPNGILSLDFTGMAVVGVALDGSPARYTQDPGHIRVALPESTAPGDTVEVVVSYRGTPDDGLDIQRTVHGEPAAFADNWPNRARFWFPSVDHPSDKATVSFTIHAPAAWDVVANGYLAEPPVTSPTDAMGAPGHRRTWRWEQTVPIPTYTIVLGATRFARTVQGTAACGQSPASPREDGCIEVSYWAFPPDTAHAARTFRRSPEIVDYFTELLGPYPYEKLANVQSATRFGGMENATAIFYDQHSLALGRDMESTVVHEIAHMWFGNSVTAADWHHIWLSEGFATYLTAVFYQHHEGEEVFREIMEADRRQIVASPSSRRPVVDSTYTDLFDLLSTNSYQKGGWVLHMLRGVVGDDAFFRGIRRYYREHRNGTARTSDLQAIMEARRLGSTCTPSSASGSSSPDSPCSGEGGPGTPTAGRPSSPSPRNSLTPGLTSTSTWWWSWPPRTDPSGPPSRSGAGARRSPSPSGASNGPRPGPRRVVAEGGRPPLTPHIPEVYYHI
jgi:aminopeptidase N